MRISRQLHFMPGSGAENCGEAGLSSCPSSSQSCGGAIDEWQQSTCSSTARWTTQVAKGTGEPRPLCVYREHPRHDPLFHILCMKNCGWRDAPRSSCTSPLGLTAPHQGGDTNERQTRALRPTSRFGVEAARRAPEQMTHSRPVNMVVPPRLRCCILQRRQIAVV